MNCLKLRKLTKDEGITLFEGKFPNPHGFIPLMGKRHCKGCPSKVEGICQDNCLFRLDETDHSIHRFRDKVVEPAKIVLYFITGAGKAPEDPKPQHRIYKGDILWDNGVPYLNVSGDFNISLLN